MANKKVSSIADLLPDKRNVNKHSEFGTHLLNKSIQENGVGRSILISSDNEIIAGNGVVEVAGGTGIEKVRVIDTDGSELIAVRRTDIKSGSKQFYAMALADNLTAKNNIVLDADVANAIAEDYPDIKDWVDTINQDAPKGQGNNLNHDRQFILTLKFTDENQFNNLKDFINRSGKTAEQIILKALKITK